jgi:hypothetical protein
MRLVRSCCVVAALLGHAHAEGDALVDMLGPREVAMGEAMRGGATGATSIGLNPAGLPLNRELVFEGGYGYRPSDNASLIGVSACDSTNAVPGCFYYQYAGSNPDMHRRTHVAGLSLAYPITPRVILGSSSKYYNFRSEIMDEPKASGFNIDVGATLRLTDIVNVGLAGYNLRGAETPELPRAAGGGVLVRPSSMFALGIDARWKFEGEDQGARYGAGAELFLRSANGQSGYPIRAGALRDNGLDATYLSAGAGYAGMKFSIDVAARYAVSGPAATQIMASMRFYGARMRSPALEME